MHHQMHFLIFQLLRRQVVIAGLKVRNSDCWKAWCVSDGNVSRVIERSVIQIGAGRTNSVELR
jgi:hypothetical protein